MSTEDLNVPTDAPIDIFRTPNVAPQFGENEVNYGAKGTPVKSDEDVTTGSKGEPITIGG